MRLSELIESLQALQKEGEDPIVLVPGHSDGTGYFEYTNDPYVGVVSYCTEWSWSGSGHYFEDSRVPGPTSSAVIIQ